MTSQRKRNTTFTFMMTLLDKFTCRTCLLLTGAAVTILVLYVFNWIPFWSSASLTVFTKQQEVVIPTIRSLPAQEHNHQPVEFDLQGDTLVKSDDIPRIIHQTWKTTKIAQLFEKWILSWRHKNPGWEYWFWTDEDIRRLVQIRYPEYLQLFDSYPSGGYRADAFRYLVLYEYGGVYADLDAECLQPLDVVRDEYTCIVAQEPHEHAHFLSSIGIPLVSNAVMACRPGHPFFHHVIQSLPRYTGWHQWNDILHATGPYMLTPVYKEYTGVQHTATATVHLAEPHLFEPSIDYSRLDHMKDKCTAPADDYRFYSTDYLETQRRLCNGILAMTFNQKVGPESITDHHWTHLWAGPQYDPHGVANWRTFVDVAKIMQ